MRIAVVGSGAAAVGALQGILGSGRDVKLTVFDIGKPLGDGSWLRKHPRDWGVEGYQQLYEQIRADHGRRFPPPKTHFGESLPRYQAGGTDRIFRSELFGGLTNFWGGTMLPFTNADMVGWPVDAESLWPYHHEIAEIVGVSGRRDALNHYFTEDFANRPPLRPTTVLDRLDASVNEGEAKGDYDVYSGLNRVALETREDHSRRCVYCGECMSGCFASSIYSAKQTMERFVGESRVDALVKGKVLAVDPAQGSVRVSLPDGGEVVQSGFDKIMLAAGCAGTTEIVMRSLGLGEGPKLSDNAVYVFPVFHLGRGVRETNPSEYLALCNLIFGCVPRQPSGRFAQAQVYLNFDYLWRYYIPPRLWSVCQSFGRALRARLFWVRLYLHGNHSPSYPMRMQDDRLEFFQDQVTIDQTALLDVMTSLRSVLCRNGFYTPAVKPMLQKTSSHYASTLPYGNRMIPVTERGRIERGVYVCDSTCFPESPAVSPTFTIMAMACRTAREALSDD